MEPEAIFSGGDKTHGYKAGKQIGNSRRESSLGHHPHCHYYFTGNCLRSSNEIKNEIAQLIILHLISICLSLNELTVMKCIPFMLWSQVRIIKIWPKIIHTKKYKVKNLQFSVPRYSFLFWSATIYHVSQCIFYFGYCFCKSKNVSAVSEVLSTLTGKCLPC